MEPKRSESGTVADAIQTSGVVASGCAVIVDNDNDSVTIVQDPAGMPFIHTFKKEDNESPTIYNLRHLEMKKLTENNQKRKGPLIEIDPRQKKSTPGADLELEVEQTHQTEFEDIKVEVDMESHPITDDVDPTWMDKYLSEPLSIATVDVPHQFRILDDDLARASSRPTAPPDAPLSSADNNELDKYVGELLSSFNFLPSSASSVALQEKIESEGFPYPAVLTVAQIITSSIAVETRTVSSQLPVGQTKISNDDELHTPENNNTRNLELINEDLSGIGKKKVLAASVNKTFLLEGLPSRLQASLASFPVPLELQDSLAVPQFDASSLKVVEPVRITTPSAAFPSLNDHSYALSPQCDIIIIEKESGAAYTNTKLLQHNGGKSRVSMVRKKYGIMEYRRTIDGEIAGKITLDQSPPRIGGKKGRLGAVEEMATDLSSPSSDKLGSRPNSLQHLQFLNETLVNAVSRERKRRKKGVLPPRFVEVDETVVDIASPLAPQRNNKDADPEGKISNLGENKTKGDDKNNPLKLKKCFVRLEKLPYIEQALAMGVKTIRIPPNGTRRS